MAGSMASNGQPDTNGSSRNGCPTSTNPTSGTGLNPAALLNPRGYTDASAVKTASPKPFDSASSSAPMEFEFSNPDDTFTSGSQLSLPDHPVQANGQAASHTNGYGSMIERMNNLQQRTSAPDPKRRKLDSDDSDESKPGFRSGGSGMLGQHIKEKRQEAASQPAAKRVVTVDLTDSVEDGDGDVVETNSPKDEEICYGMIQNARLNCHIVPSPKPGTVSLMGDSYWPIVKIVLRRLEADTTNAIHAYDHTRKIVGTVDPAISAGLAGLLDASRLSLRTDCRINSRRKEAGEVVGKPISKSYALDLVVYGLRRHAKTVGRHLSTKQVWLRKPFLLGTGIKYENPQEVVAPRSTQPVVRERYTAPSGPQMARTVEEIRSEVMGVFDSLTKSEDLPEMDPDPRVQTELLKHQKQGLHFMMQKEKPRQLRTDGKTPDSFWQIRFGNNSQRIYHNVITGHFQREPPPETFGGILADMMGLGKTLSILSLIASSFTEADDWSRTEPVQPRGPAPKKNGHAGNQFNVPTPEPLALTPVKQNSKATLLICPLSTIANWEEQIKAHIQPGKMSYYIYHGGNRVKDVKKLAEYDLVMTTYGSVASEVQARNKGRHGPYPLEEIGWFRVVLDEAHMVREQSTLQFKAICRLQANRRWAVTGTPVQNKLDDLAALLAFLRVKPFEERSKFTQYITTPFKICDPEIVPKLRVLVDSITLRRLKDKIDLPPRVDQLIRLDFSPNERKLYSLFEQSAQDKVNVLAAGREKMIGGKTYIHILQSILRLRLISAHGRDLLNEADLELVQGMTEDSAIDLDSDDEDEKPVLAESRAYEAFALMQETNGDLCISCQKRISSNDGGDVASERDEDILGYMTSCFHLICPQCIKAWDAEVEGRVSGACPVCQNHVHFAYSEIRKSKADVEHEGHRQTKPDGKTRTRDGYTGYSGPHTKTRALLDDLLKSEAESEAHPDEPPYKSVVFSAWTSHLDLIQIALDNAGIRYTRLDGKMTRVARGAALDAFRDDASVHVILVSISAGGLGLNLTTANSVYVMEPQYNPAAEAQAVDRVHRLGQKRPVKTVRYIMQNSIEEKMLLLQEKKMKLASLSMDRNKVMDKAEAAKQKLLDLRDLFK